MTTKISGNANLNIESYVDLMWILKPIGEVFYLRDDLAGVSIPPTDRPDYRYIKFTASDSYNSGVLVNETVSGSAPLVIATATIGLAASPFYGLTINLINSEGRFLRASVSSGSLQDSQNLAHSHGIYYLPGYSGGTGDGPLAAMGSSSSSTTFSGGAKSSIYNQMVVPNGSTEARPKNQGISAYMRIK